MAQPNLIRIDPFSDDENGGDGDANDGDDDAPLALDDTNAFLNGDLKEEVYMVPPPGVSYNPGERTSTRCIILSLYVDDMIITSDDVDGIMDLNKMLAQEFNMKDLRPLHYFLGIEVAYSPKGYLLSQLKYVADILDRAYLTNSQSIDTPLEVNACYTPIDGIPILDPTLYCTIVGSLVYLTITHPDIVYVVHIMSQFVASSTSVHCFVPTLMRIGLLILLIENPLPKFCIFLGDSLISWKSKKQAVVSHSSTQVEYRVMASTTIEIVWLRWFLADMSVIFYAPTPLHCDNRSAI
ncbi:uncharacterized mitochondrial protein AtMg00810-like [Malania oleifera]|uniref:uncharacterized mitochondrial protein AtMg00810-like n=1 Tax=Malania oleifera TaxID=397392 RepID=UPI0025AE39F9|nr:uncharacterized mitochondrial protein AtMg00810-like [Malania oleifera]